MKYTKRNLLLAGVYAPMLMVAAPQVAFAQSTSAADQDEIVVLGSRRAQSRSTLTAPVPVDTVKAEDLTKQGSSDIIDGLVSVIPSLNTSREPISDAATLVRPVNLRALPSDHTLVLVNGKRRHRGAVVGEFVSGVNRGAQGVDINPLFGTSLKQVEVLRDGASAQYGSDAIAGVMNYTLSDDPNARRFMVQYGQAYEGDGTTIEAAGLVGFGLGDDGFLTVAMNIKDQEQTSRGLQDGIGDGGGATGLAAAGFPVDEPVVNWGQPNVNNDYKFAVNAAVPAGDGEVYTFGTFATREVDGSFFFRNPTNRSGVFASGGNHLFADTTGAGGCPEAPLPMTSFADATAFVNGAPDNCFSFFTQFPGGFTPRFGGVVEDKAITAGFRGDINGGLTYDFSAGIGSNNLDYSISNTVNASLGPNTPTTFNLGSQTQTEFVANADFSIAKDVGLASDLNIAFGAQFLTESFEIGAGDPESFVVGPFIDQGFSAGANGFQGFSDSVAGKFDRDNIGVYLDLEADVTERLILSGAVRYEDFSDFGDTLNAKIAGLFEVSEDLNLRGSFSTGFRAPTLGQANLQRSSTGFVAGALTEQLTIASTNPIAQFFGGGQLDPEKARNISIGATGRFGGLSITADYFNIKVEDRVSLVLQPISAEEQQQLVTAGNPEAATITQVNFFTNDFDTRTQGVDIVATYPVESDFGSTDLTLAYNYNDTDVTDRGATITDAREKELELSMPSSRFTATASHTKGAWDGLVRVNYYSEVFDSLFQDPGLPITTDPVTIVDAEVGYTVSETFRIGVGAKNLFDTYPEEWETGGFTGRTSGFLGLIHPPNHPAGFNGGSYYVRVSANF